MRTAKVDTGMILELRLNWTNREHDNRNSRKLHLGAGETGDRSKLSISVVVHTKLVMSQLVLLRALFINEAC